MESQKREFRKSLRTGSSSPPPPRTSPSPLHPSFGRCPSRIIFRTVVAVSQQHMQIQWFDMNSGVFMSRGISSQYILTASDPMEPRRGEGNYAIRIFPHFPAYFRVIAFPRIGLRIFAISHFPAFSRIFPHLPSLFRYFCIISVTTCVRRWPPVVIVVLVGHCVTMTIRRVCLSILVIFLCILSSYRCFISNLDKFFPHPLSSFPPPRFVFPSCIYKKYLQIFFDQRPYENHGVQCTKRSVSAVRASRRISIQKLLCSDPNFPIDFFFPVLRSNPYGSPLVFLIPPPQPAGHISGRGPLLHGNTEDGLLIPFYAPLRRFLQVRCESK